MNASQPSFDQQLRQFLLGTLPEADQEELERRLLSDDESHELLIAVEEEILDECLRGSVDEPQARSFLGYLERLPDGRARIDFAQNLRTCLSRTAHVETPSPKGLGAFFTRLRALAAGLSPRPIAWSALVLLAAVSSGFLAGAFIFSGRVRTETARATSRSMDSGPLSSPSLVLVAGRMRSSGVLPVVELSPSHTLLGLKLDLGSAEHASYQAVVYDADARELFSVSQLSPESTANQILVVFAIPTDRLPSGDYFVDLYGMAEAGERDPLGRYDFRVLTR